MLKPIPCPRCGMMPEIDTGFSDAPYPPGQEYVSCPGVRVGIPGVVDQSCGTHAIGVAAWNYRAIPATDAAHVNETLKSEHDAGNVLTDAAQSRAPFFFDRYINGVRMAEDVCIERETTLEGAMQAAARIAAKGPKGEAPVLIYRAPAALTDGGSNE